MINKILISATLSSLVFFSACSNSAKPNITINDIFTPQYEACPSIEEKFLKTYSFMQIIQKLGAKDNVKFHFTPSSEDVMVINTSFLDWEDAIVWLDQQNEYSVKIYGLSKKGAVKTIEMHKNTPSFLELMTESNVEKKYKLSSDTLFYYIPSAGKITISKELMNDYAHFCTAYNTNDMKDISIQRVLTDFYYFCEQRKINIYFDYDKKAKRLYVLDSKVHTTMTPYKMRILRNYMHVNNIEFNKDGQRTVVLTDDFMSWNKAQRYIKSINKYGNNIYGIKTNDGYYEVSDGRYPVTPISLELISWTPKGEKEFNIYYNGDSSKITTTKKVFSYFVEDKKFSIRTY